MTDKKQTYRIKADIPAGRVDYILPLGTVAQSYPIVKDQDGMNWVPLSCLLLIEGLSENDMELECIEYPKQGDN